MKDETLREKILRWFSEWARLKPLVHLSDSQNIFPKRDLVGEFGTECRRGNEWEE